MKKTSSTQVQQLNDLGGTEMIQAELSDFRFPLHFHETFVIELIQTGVDWCPGNQLAAQKGELCVHFPFAAHSGGTMRNQQLSYQAIYPSVNLVAELTGVTNEELESACSFVSSDRALIREVESLFSQVSKPNSNGQRQSLANVFDAILNSKEYKVATCLATSGQRAIWKTMVSIQNYLSSNFNRDVTNLELSSRFGVSEFHLIREFKKCFGITPRQFLISRRVVESKRLMAGGMSVVAAAHTAGFSDQSHLARQFKRITGYSPGRFRNAHALSER